MIEYKRDSMGQITKDGHTMMPGDVLKDLKRMAYLETLYAGKVEEPDYKVAMAKLHEYAYCGLAHNNRDTNQVREWLNAVRFKSA